jgi:hypothetical protein
MKQFAKSLLAAKLMLIPLLFFVACTYYFWYQVLLARGFGYGFNAMKYRMPFAFARLLLLMAILLGLIAYHRSRNFLPIPWRVGYVLIVGFGIAHFIVHWIIIQFGPEPFWGTI